MTPLNFFIGFIIFAVVILAIGYALVKWGQMCKDQFNEYEEYYEKLHTKVFEWTINKPNYNMLMSQFKVLGNMKWKDRNKTLALMSDFLHRFKKEAKKSVNE